jgi:hypothetical protein
MKTATDREITTAKRRCERRWWNCAVFRGADSTPLIVFLGRTPLRGTVTICLGRYGSSHPAAHSAPHPRHRQRRPLRTGWALTPDRGFDCADFQVRARVKEPALVLVALRSSGRGKLTHAKIRATIFQS